VKDETPRDAFDRDLSAAASSLKKGWDSPELWPRIERALLLESSRKASAAPEKVGFFEDLFGSLGRNWRPALAGLALFGLATAGLLVFRGSGGRDPYTVSSSHVALLTEQAASEVERTEAAYVASIEKLSQLAAPRLLQATEPVLVNYREKLALLDGAIAELKTNIEQNRFNTHLREELLAMYKEKQRTLQDILQEVKS
jgi:hypothetical protein